MAISIILQKYYAENKFSTRPILNLKRNLIYVIFDHCEKESNK